MSERAKPPNGVVVAKGLTKAFTEGGRTLDVAAGFLWLRRVGPDEGRLYYAKAFAHPLAAAPFVAVLGTRGLTLFNGLLLSGALWLSYALLRRRGHAGDRSAEQLWRELSSLGVPLIGAGGVGSPAEFKAMLDLGYAGVQLGTRFIATPECRAHDDYKNAILRAEEHDIVLTKRKPALGGAMAGLALLAALGATFYGIQLHG